MRSTTEHTREPDPQRRGPRGGKLRCYQDGGWLDDWTAGCPRGYPQRPVTLLGCRLTAADCVQIRVALGGGDDGVCRLFAEQSDDCIYVSAWADRETDEEPTADADDAVDIGCPVWLDEPLGVRTVAELDTGVELPWLHLREGSFTPWLYVPRPPGDLWPSDGLEAVALDELRLLAARLPDRAAPRPAEHCLVEILDGIGEPVRVNATIDTRSGD
jgi:hypothetical protein